MEERMKHLWEIDHPYYCGDGNYHSNDYTQNYDSWTEFIAAEGDSDVDLNLLFRFDWNDYENDGSLLQLCYMLQRKGAYRTVFIKVDHDDEPGIKVFLKERYEVMKSIWEPFAKEYEDEGTEESGEETVGENDGL